METLWGDIRYGIRMLTNSPGVTLVAILTLGLGVGVNTAVFSVVNAFILRPLPVRDSDRLVILASRRPSNSSLRGISFPDLQDYRVAAGDVFEDIAGYTVGFVGLAPESGRSERVLTTWVTGNYFTLLDLRPALGRMIRAEEGDPGKVDPVVVIGYSTWRRKFAGDPYIVGQTTKVNGTRVTIVGVAPPGFRGTLAFSNSELYLPVNWAGKGALDQRDARSLHAVARLRPGVTIAQAQAEMNVVADRLERRFPTTNWGVSVRVVPERLARPEEDNARTNILGAAILTVLVGLVLIVAAVNVTSILLARAVGRQREIAIRAALGAGRWRIIRQLMTESLLLATAGGLVGVLFGAWSGNLLAKIGLPGNLPVAFDFHLDWRVMLYAASIVLLAGTMIGLVSALKASRVDSGGMLHDSRLPIFVGGGRHGVHRVLVAAQIAVCFVLLVGGGLLIRSLLRAEQMDLGFQPRDVLNLHMDVGQLGYTEARGSILFHDIERRVRALPGVEDLSFAFTIPMGYVYTSRTIGIEGQSVRAHDRPLAGMNVVGPAYFATMGIPIISGRSFAEQDDELARRVALVNERFAEDLWPGRNPLGRRFRLSGNEGPWIEVVGVTKTGRYHLLYEDPQPYFYVPLAQYYTGLRVLHVRASVPPETLVPSIERVIHALEPELILFDVQSMQRALGGGYGLFLVRAGALFGAIFGMLGLMLVAVGLYGVMSFTMSERIHEIGVRMALGAAPSDVLRFALKKGLAPVAAGLGIGIPGAIATACLTSNLLFGIAANDPSTFVGVTLFLAIVAIAACYLPGRRASQTDPMTALRHE